MTTPDLTPLELIHLDAAALDAIATGIRGATERLDEAENAWEEAYDKVAESLAEEHRQAGRKADPAEHTILATTRRQHRLVWTEFRRAKRDLERLERQLQAKRASVNARQSELNALRAEAGVQDHLGQPRWSRSGS